MSEPFRTASPPSTENAVRSIRVASTLIERFQAILASRSSLMTVDEIELLIGESQQLYPEIWRHLDEGARELGKLGRNISQYEQLRREELGHLGVTDVDSSTMVDPFSLLLGSYRQITVKSASFNEDGCRRAAYVAGVLMNAMPEVDWHGLAQAEAREIAAAGSLQSKKYLTIVKIAVGVGLLVLAVVGIRALAMSSPEAEYHRERREDEARIDQPAIDARREAIVRRMARIDELWAQFARTCETPVRLELMSLLREDGRGKDADLVEHKACTPARPTARARSITSRSRSSTRCRASTTWCRTATASCGPPSGAGREP